MTDLGLLVCNQKCHNGKSFVAFFETLVFV